jgi:RHS repeat-associated protein
MNPSKRTRKAILIVVAITTFLFIAGSAVAGEPAGQRYIVILKQRSGAAPDVAALGGTVEFRQEDQLVITLPPSALAALKADPKVRYIEQVGGQVGGEPAAADTPLIGVPADPQPGPASQTRRFTPQALGNTQWSSGTYLYDGAGNIVSIGSDNYLYDGVQRLKQSSTQGTSETYTYDGFGNMKTRTNIIMPNVLPASNRYDGYNYNEIGAVRSDGSYTFTYDALGQPLSKKYGGDASTLEYYVYTPSDERIGVQRGAWWWWSVRDESGKVLRQYKSSATDPTQAALWVEDFVWRDGLLLGSQRPPEMGGRRHFHLDHLGTPRLITSDAGQLVSYHDYYPFGDEHSPIWQEGPSAGGFDREEPMKFTGQERDYAGGMGGEDGHAIDDMHARYYSATVGRFFSPDPVLGNLLRPQSLNRYAYVSNNPLNFYDPLGLASTESGRPGPGNVDCPPGTEGVSCFTYHEHDPPQLPIQRALTWYEGAQAEFNAAMLRGFRRVIHPDYFSVSGGGGNRHVGAGAASVISRSGRAFGGWYVGGSSTKTAGVGAQATMGWILGHEGTASDVDSS